MAKLMKKKTAGWSCLAFYATKVFHGARAKIEVDGKEIVPLPWVDSIEVDDALDIVGRYAAVEIEPTFPVLTATGERYVFVDGGEEKPCYVCGKPTAYFLHGTPLCPTC